METLQIIVSGYPDRESVPVEFKHTGDGVWEADVGNGFEAYANFEEEPTETTRDSQERTVKQLLRKEFDVTYGGTPEDLPKYDG